MSDDKKVIFSMQRLSKSYQGSDKQVLKNIYLSFFYGAKIGILGLNGSGKSSLLKTPIHVELRSEMVEVYTLDSFYIEEIGLIKIDVEGGELGVLKGATKTLKGSGWPRIIFECWSYPWFAMQKIELMDYLASLGYTVTPIEWPDMFLAERRE